MLARNIRRSRQKPETLEHSSLEFVQAKTPSQRCAPVGVVALCRLHSFLEVGTRKGARSLVGQPTGATAAPVAASSRVRFPPLEGLAMPMHTMSLQAAQCAAPQSQPHRVRLPSSRFLTTANLFYRGRPPSFLWSNHCCAAGASATSDEGDDRVIGACFR